MRQGQVQINSENLLPIIKKWLYSEKDIFVRELVSNACDACTKLSLLRDRNEFSGEIAHRIDIIQDKENKTITFRDTGIGLNADEAERFLAQIAFSGAQEFIHAYQIDDPFIGHFGLGFYSAYMIADKVEVHSRSYDTSHTPIIYSSDGSSTYTIQQGNKETIGTDVILYVNKDHEEYLEETRLREILRKNCAFLPYPIYLNTKPINIKNEPLWIKLPNQTTEQEYIDFYKQLYPLDPEPLFWIHLNVDYPFHVKGILYFPRVNREYTSTDKSTVQLYCNRVFVSDSAKDILPEYLMMLKGAIDSPDIPLNVSRSYLQVDKTVRQLGSHISKKVADALHTLFTTKKERFIECWKDIEILIKLGILHDDKFYAKAKDFLIWKTTKNEWLKLDEYLEKHSQKTSHSVYYTHEGHLNQALTKLYESQDIDVLIVSPHPLDSAILAHFERDKKDVKFKRIDAEIEHFVEDKTKENTVLDSEGKTEAHKIAQFMQQSLNKPEITIEAKSLASKDIVGFLSEPEEERRMRQYFSQIAPNQKYPSEKNTFIINTNNSLITAAYKISDKQPELAAGIAQHVYDLARISQNEMEPEHFREFIQRNFHLMEDLVSQLANKNKE